MVFKYFYNPVFNIGNLFYILVGVNSIIWIRFIYRIIKGRVNWAHVLIIAYFVGPSLFGSAGGRLRLPIEWMLL